jgi:hypothetical protein
MTENNIITNICSHLSDYSYLTTYQYLNTIDGIRYVYVANYKDIITYSNVGNWKLPAENKRLLSDKN